MTANRNIREDQLSTNKMIERGSHGLSTLESWLGHTKKAAILDNMLLDGATEDELKEVRGAVVQHLNHLKKEHGVECSKINGIFRMQKSRID